MMMPTRFLFTLLHTLLFSLLSLQSAQAQAPGKFNYQGTARNLQGEPLSDKLIALRISILSGAQASEADYVEHHLVKTNTWGLYQIALGTGTSSIGTLEQVKWNQGHKYIRVEMDPEGGTAYQTAGITELLSVPYALFANQSGTARELSTQSTSGTRASNNFIEKTSATGVLNSNSLLFDNGTNIGLNTTNPLARFHVNGTTGSTTEIRLQHAASSGSSRFAFFADNGTSFTTTNDYTVMNKYTAGTAGTLTPGFPIRSLYAFSNSKGSLFFTSAANVGFGQWNPLTNTYSTRLFVDSATGNIGLGTVTPQARLDVNGQIRISGGAPGVGKVLTSDANGLATWQNPSGGSGTIGGSGTLNYLSRFTPNGSTLGNSLLWDNGQRIGLGTSTPQGLLHIADATLLVPGITALQVNTIKGKGISVETDSLVAGEFRSDAASPAYLDGVLQGEHYATNATQDYVGVEGRSQATNGFGIGVRGKGGYAGVRGQGFVYGVYGSTNNNLGSGVYGESTFGSGISGFSNNGIAVDGFSFTQHAMYGYSPKGIAASFSADSNSAGYFHSGSADSSAALLTNGVLFAEYTGSRVQQAIAIVGKSTPTTLTNNFGIGVRGIGNWIGVWGSSPNFAGYFNGQLFANSATSSIKAFKIDHPQDPANKYLYHSSVESNDMMNIYNGNVVTDAQGVAVVELPSYFEALNTDFKYQLTVIGTFAQAIIAEKIHQNRFTIKTNVPNVEVSWMVTGIRQDAVAQQQRIQVEVEKGVHEKGKYLNPGAFGLPERMALVPSDYEGVSPEPKAEQQKKRLAEQHAPR